MSLRNSWSTSAKYSVLIAQPLAIMPVVIRGICQPGIKPWNLSSVADSPNTSLICSTMFLLISNRSALILPSTINRFLIHLVRYPVWIHTFRMLQTRSLTSSSVPVHLRQSSHNRSPAASNHQSNSTHCQTTELHTPIAV